MRYSFVVFLIVSIAYAQYWPTSVTLKDDELGQQQVNVNFQRLSNEFNRRMATFESGQSTYSSHHSISSTTIKYLLEVQDTLRLTGPNLGTTRANSGVGKNEIWVDTDDSYTIKFSTW